MMRLLLENFGPITQGYLSGTEFVEVKKFTVFIGNQATGKSTIAKLIATFSWLEKAVLRGDFTLAEVLSSDKFQYEYCAYQRLQDYFRPDTKLVYIGTAYTFVYNEQKLTAFPNAPGPSADIRKHYETPKIMYAPAERNLLTIAENPEQLERLPRPLFTFFTEYVQARKGASKPVELPINDLHFQYDNSAGTAYIVLANNERVKLSEASSGLQSAVPLYLVSRFLAASLQSEPDASVVAISLEQQQRIRERVRSILANIRLSDDEIMDELEQLSAVQSPSRFLNIVEELEQNLFPSSQRALLYAMLSFANDAAGSSLVLTTHSPYVINHLSIAIQGGQLLQKLRAAKRQDLEAKLAEIVPTSACLSEDDVAVYELADGRIHRLSSVAGIPSDQNYLNQSLAEGNRTFDALLEIEQEL